MTCWVISAVLLVTGLTHASTKINQNSKSILILGSSKSKALHLARLFKANGYVTVLCETKQFPIVFSSWSRYCDHFFKLSSPHEAPNLYIQEIVNIAKKHNATYFVPMEARYVQWDIEVISKISEFCFPLTCDEETFEELDNKFRFSQRIKQMKLRGPICEYITQKDQVLKFLSNSSGTGYILKPVVYDAYHRGGINIPSDPEKLETYLESKNISETFPYVLQNRLVLPECASCTLVLKSNILAHTVGYSSRIHQSFDHADQPEITQWVKDFVEKYPKPITGWLTIDFMKSPEDGHFYPLECNPRLGSSFMQFQRYDNIVEDIEHHLGINPNKTNSAAVYKAKLKEPSVKQLYWLMNELWVMLSNLHNFQVLKKRLTIIRRGKEAVFEFNDPLPFLFLCFAQTPAIIIKNMFVLNDFRIVDYCVSGLRY